MAGQTTHLDASCCRQVANALAVWLHTGECPVMDVVVQPDWKGLSETIEHVTLLKAQATPVVESCRAILAAGSEQLQLAIQLLQALGMRGVMTLLGCRQTAGPLRTAHPLNIGHSL